MLELRRYRFGGHVPKALLDALRSVCPCNLLLLSSSYEDSEVERENEDHPELLDMAPGLAPEETLAQLLAAVSEGASTKAAAAAANGLKSPGGLRGVEWDDFEYDPETQRAQDPPESLDVRMLRLPAMAALIRSGAVSYLGLRFPNGRALAPEPEQLLQTESLFQSNEFLLSDDSQGSSLDGPPAAASCKQHSAPSLTAAQRAAVELDASALRDALRVAPPTAALAAGPDAGVSQHVSDGGAAGAVHMPNAFLRSHNRHQGMREHGFLQLPLLRRGRRPEQVAAA